MKLLGLILLVGAVVGYRVTIGRVGHDSDSIEDACSQAPGGCAPYEPFDVPESDFVEGRYYDNVNIALIEVGKTAFSENEYNDAVSRLTAYINGDNAGNIKIPAMWPIQQLILKEADGKRVYFNAIGVSIPNSVKSWPAPNDPSIEFHLNYKTVGYVNSFSGNFDNSNLAQVYNEKFGQLSAELDRLGIKYDKNVKVAMDFGDRYDPQESRREIGYLQHIAMSPLRHDSEPIEDACKKTPGGCAPYKSFKVEGSNFVEGRNYDNVNIALIELSKTDFDQAEYEDAVSRLTRYINGDNKDNAEIPAMWPVQQIILKEADGKRIYYNAVGVSVPESLHSLPVPNDANIDFHRNYKTVGYVKAFTSNFDTSYLQEVYHKMYGELSAELDRLNIQYDKNVKVAMDFGERYSKTEARREVGYLIHIASSKLNVQHKPDPIDVACSKAPGGCAPYQSFEVKGSKFVEGRNLDRINLALIKLGKTDFGEQEYKDAVSRLQAYISGDNKANAKIDAMWPIQQIILKEADGKKIYYNAVAVSIPGSVTSWPAPNDANIDFHENYQTSGYFKAFPSNFDAADLPSVYHNAYHELSAELDRLGIQYDINVKVALDYGDRYSKEESRREVGYLVHLASSFKPAVSSIDEICAKAPGGCPTFTSIDVEGSTAVEGRAYDQIYIALIALSKNPYNREEYMDAVQRLHAYVNGDNAGNVRIPAMWPVQQLILLEADGKHVYRNYVAVSIPNDVKSIPKPNDANIQFHVNYDVDAFVIPVTHNCAREIEKSFDNLREELQSAKVDVDTNVKIILDYGDRYSSNEERIEVGYLRHLA